MTGFFEESSGVRSMTRLAIFALLVLAAAVVGAICWYVLGRPSPDHDIVLALVAALGALVLNGVVAIVKRNGGDDAQG